jgi:hypothetical protein
MKILKAGGALALLALAFPAAAQAHHATVTVSCTEAVISYASFPHGSNTVHYVVKVDNTVAAEGDYTFSGSTATKRVPLTVYGDHSVAVSTSWNTNGVAGDDYAQKDVGCGAAPPPPVAPAPAAAAPVPASGVQGVQVSSPAVAPARAVLGTRSSCASRTVRATVTGRNMRRVTFSSNGRVVRTITVRGRRTVRATLPRRGTGPQAVTVRVRYANRTEVLTARANRCAQAQVQPQFTG